MLVCQEVDVRIVGEQERKHRASRVSASIVECNEHGDARLLDEPPHSPALLVRDSHLPAELYRPRFRVIAAWINACARLWSDRLLTVNCLPRAVLYDAKKCSICPTRSLLRSLRSRIDRCVAEFSATASSRSFRCVCPSSTCSASITPTSRECTTHPGNTGASMSTRISSGSPSSPRVEGTKPKSNGNTAPAGSTVFSTNVPSRGSNASLLGEPFGVSITTIRRSSPS